MGSVRILLIEDDPLNAQFFLAVLERDGHAIEHESSGILGEARALAAPFDLVLRDIDLPGQDGLSICRRLRATGFVGKLVALTIHSDEPDRAQAREAGFDDFLEKPITPSAPRAAVRAHAP